MGLKWLLAASAAVMILQMPSGAQAFGCPKAIAEAQALIDKVAADMKGMKGKVSKEDHALVHALLDDAKSLVAGSKHNHEKPQGAYDHARAIAKANAARGYAHAADVFHFSVMKK